MLLTVHYLRLYNKFVFFIWKHLDLFIAMQQYLTFIPSIDRPSFKDINTTKCQEDFPRAFRTDTTETYNAMSKMKSTNSGVITTGLWPLDHESYYDWRQTTHKKSVWTQWIYMARIEKILVDRYRVKMIRKSPHTALIRDTLASLLSPLCNMATLTLTKPRQGDKAPEKKFYWPDNIKVEPKQAQAPQPAGDGEQATVDPKAAPGTVPMKVGDPIDVDNLRSQQLRKEETEAMVAEITSIFKKLHSTKAGLAIRGQQGFRESIVEKLDDLEEVCNSSV